MDIIGPFRILFSGAMDSVNSIVAQLENAIGAEPDANRRAALAELLRLLQEQRQKVAGVGESQMEGLKVRIEAGLRAHQAVQERSRALARRIDTFRTRLKEMEVASVQQNARGGSCRGLTKTRL